MASADNELKIYLLSDEDWNRIQEVESLMECFQTATLAMSEANHPTLCQTIPIYNYLLDIIEDFIDKKKPSEDVVIAANNAKEKLLRYYPTSDGLVYIISTILDSKNKMEYYHENGFDDYIEIYKKQITELWKKNYMPAQITINPPNTSNVLVNYIYKKRKFVQPDELDNYLNSPPANIETNTLLYWKVVKIYIINCTYLLLLNTINELIID
ncbi:unnamed protein product [Rhizophagus irregularis]|nr:unnamed protein product [Rhizophagus irregularis]